MSANEKENAPILIQNPEFSGFSSLIESLLEDLDRFVLDIGIENLNEKKISAEERKLLIDKVSTILLSIYDFMVRNPPKDLNENENKKVKGYLESIILFVKNASNNWGFDIGEFNVESSNEEDDHEEEYEPSNEDKFEAWKEDFKEKLIALEELARSAKSNGEVESAREIQRQLLEEFTENLEIFVEFIRTVEKAFDKRFQQIEKLMLEQDRLFYIYELNNVVSEIEAKKGNDRYNPEEDIDNLSKSIEDAKAELPNLKPRDRKQHGDGIIKEADELLKELEKIKRDSEADALAAEEEAGREEKLNSLSEAIIESLKKAAAKTQYLVDGHQNQIDKDRQITMELYDSYKEASPDDKDLARIKEKITEVFYSIYRKKLLGELEYYENKYIPFGSVKWKEVLEDKIVAQMQNLAEEHLGFSLGSISDLEEKSKEEGSSITTNEAVDKLIDENDIPEDEADFYKEIIRDLLNIQKEYVARKFAHLSWTQLQPKILPTESGARNYPEGVTGDNHPVLFVVDYLLREGLEESRFGKGTNRVVEEGRKRTIKSFERYGERKEVVSNATTFGEAWRALDRWARGKLDLRYEDNTKISTARAHAAESAIVTALTTYLNKNNKFKGDKKIPSNDVLRAYRVWATTTYHQSARAIRSSEGPDSMYYAHQFADYNAGYVKKGTDSWQPLVAEMVFGVVDPITQEKINPLHYIWGDIPELSNQRGVLDRVSPFPQGYKAMANSLKEGGFLSFSEERKKREGFASYNFLLSPLLTMPDLSQAEDWIEQTDGSGNVVRIRTSDLPDNHPMYMKDTSEDFAEQPVLGTVFFRDKDGKVLRYPSRYDTDGTEIKGKPISLFDFQDEWGEQIYEEMPWSTNVEALYSVTNSIGSNGYRFLKNFLKSKDFLKMIGDAAEISYFKNEGKYVMMHLPSLGTLFAAGMHMQEDELKMLPDALMNMLIAQLVFIGVIIKTDTGNEDHWTISQIEKYLDGLVVNSRAISSETADAIFTAIKGAQQFNIRVSGGVNSFVKRLEERFKYTK